MSGEKSHRIAVIAVWILALAAIGSQLAGWAEWHDLWVLKSWKYTPLWYLIVWGCLSIGLLALIWTKSKSLIQTLNSPTATRLAIGTIVVFIGVFHFDSFVAGDGNLRVAQIAQSEYIALHWYEFGTIGLVTILFKFLSLVGLAANTAGVWAWRLFSFTCTFMTLIGALRLSRLIAGSKQAVIATLAVIIFGGPFLMLLGYIGVEPLVITATVWFAVTAWNCATDRKPTDFLLLWAVIASACFMLFQTVFLIPPALCVTAASLTKHKRNWIMGGVAGVVAAAVGILWLYKMAASSPGLAQYLVLPGGKLPLANYTLFSNAAVFDNMQITLGAVPLALLILWLVFLRLPDKNDRVFAITIFLTVISGRILIRVLDPINGVVLDFPRLTAYLAPVGIMLAFCLHRALKLGRATPRFYLMTAALSVVLPLSVIPTFTKISWTDPLAAKLAEKTDHFYRTTGLAFRDAYFYRKELDRANAWEWSLPVKSPDFLNMRGCSDLVTNGQFNDALVSLYRLTARQPYWAEPRALLAAVQLQLGRDADAKGQIDTCLMLRPDSKEHQILRYRYFQAAKRIDSAYLYATSAHGRFPADMEIGVDLMKYAFQLKKVDEADSLARRVLSQDSDAPAPHLILARMADQRGLVDSAVAEYQRYVDHAKPDDPDAGAARRRIVQLKP